MEVVFLLLTKQKAAEEWDDLTNVAQSVRFGQRKRKDVLTFCKRALFSRPK